MDNNFSIGEELSAIQNITAQRLTIYFPNKNKRGEIVSNIEAYISVGMDLLAEINGGVTRLPLAQGIWVKDLTRGVSDPANLVREDSVLIYSNLNDPETFVNRIQDIRDFLHKFGRETEQGEVMLEFFGEDKAGKTFYRVYRITSYDV